MYVDPLVIKGFAVVLAAAVATIVGMITGILANAGGANLFESMIKGGTAFGGTMALEVAIMIPLDVL